MKCCIEIKYCLGVAITTKCDGFFVFKLKKDALLRERPVNNIKHINYIIPRPVFYSERAHTFQSPCVQTIIFKILG